MQTEQQNPKTLQLDTLSALEIVTLINEEDAKIASAIESVLPSIAKAVDHIVTAFENEGRLIYIGAGTSGRLGVLDAVECIPTYSAPPGMVVGLIAGGNPALTQSIEDAEDSKEAGADDLRGINLDGRDVVVGIAASGRTPYVIGALEYAKNRGAVTAAVACNAPSPILEIADIAIGVAVGPEVVTGSTRMKAGTAQKMVLNMLSTASMVRFGKVYGNLMVDVRPTNQKLVDRGERIVAQVANIEKERASELLKLTGNDVKTAIVTAIKNLPPDEAKQLLKEAKGHLRRIIEG